MVERIITLAKGGSLAERRRIVAELPNEPLVIDKLYDEIVPSYGDRNSGFTRVVKLGPRAGDAAPIVQLELFSNLSEPTSEASLAIRARRSEGGRRYRARANTTAGVRRFRPAWPSTVRRLNEPSRLNGGQREGLLGRSDDPGACHWPGHRVHLTMGAPGQPVDHRGLSPGCPN
jgi:hypothetical protein